MAVIVEPVPLLESAVVCGLELLGWPVVVVPRSGFPVDLVVVSWPGLPVVEVVCGLSV